MSKHKPIYCQGFTLIEVVIALAVFAIVASISSYVLVQSFQTEERLKKQSTHLQKLNTAITWMRRDTELLIHSSIRGQQQNLINAFIGEAQYFELTRTGYINPDAAAQRSTLQRVAYLCQSNQLIRRSWSQLDDTDRNHYHDNILLTDLKQCDFSYINAQQQLLTHWSSDHFEDNETIPIRINCSFVFTQSGTVTIALPLLIGFYD